MLLADTLEQCMYHVSVGKDHQRSCSFLRHGTPLVPRPSYLVKVVQKLGMDDQKHFNTFFLASII